MSEQTSKYLKIVEEIIGERFRLENINQKSIIGYIEKMRVGRFMHWCLIPESDTYFSNGCLKEISVFITKLYGGFEKEISKINQSSGIKKFVQKEFKKYGGFE